MAIHASQGRRSGGSKKNSRRGYGKQMGAASNFGGSEAKTASDHAPQGARSAGGVRKGVVKELDEYRKESPFNAIASSIAGSPKAVADLSGRRRAHDEKAKEWGNWRPPAKPSSVQVAQVESKEKPGGFFSVPPEKVDAKPAPVVSNKEMPAIPADAAEKGAEKAKERKPRPTTWANGTPVGSGTDKTKIHPDSLAARGKPAGEKKGENHAANEAKQNQEGTVAPKAPKVPGRSADTGEGKVSSSVTFDHSAADEARDRRAKLTAAHGAAAASAFEGDIGKTMQAGSLIRSLQQQAREADAVGPRIRSSQRSVTRPNRKFVIGDS